MWDGPGLVFAELINLPRPVGITLHKSQRGHAGALEPSGAIQFIKLRTQVSQNHFRAYATFPTISKGGDPQLSRWGASASGLSLNMFRRNKKPVSCEPCRIAKTRCDHGIPTCDKCTRRKIVDKVTKLLELVTKGVVSPFSLE